MTGQTILMMAGGTGGHVFPALAVAAELSSRGFLIEWLGARTGIENRLVPAAGIKLHLLDVTGVRGGGMLKKFKAPFMLLRSVFRARAMIKAVQPALAIGFGGYASGPGGIAARLLAVPLVLHEQNARPGMTNRMLAHIADKTLQAFPGALPDAETLGNPVRKSIFSIAEPKQRLASHDGPLRLLVLGGSQGALALNTVLPGVLAETLGSPDSLLLIRHQCGRGRREEAQTAYFEASLQAEVVEFIDHMESAYEWADVVICRAGALTVSEVAAAGVAALFVPLPSAVDDHQTLNARWLEQSGAARILAQDQLTYSGLRSALNGLLDRATLTEMGVLARQKSFPDSACRVADICQETLRV